MPQLAPHARRNAVRARFPYRHSAAPLILELSPDDPCLLLDLPADPESVERTEAPYDIVLGGEGTD